MAIFHGARFASKWFGACVRTALSTENRDTQIPFGSETRNIRWSIDRHLSTTKLGRLMVLLLESVLVLPVENLNFAVSVSLSKQHTTKDQSSKRRNDLDLYPSVVVSPSLHLPKPIHPRCCNGAQ
jgi:hypothetical protein